MKKTCVTKSRLSKIEEEDSIEEQKQIKKDELKRIKPSNPGDDHEVDLPTGNRGGLVPPRKRSRIRDLDFQDEEDQHLSEQDDQHEVDRTTYVHESRRQRGGKLHWSSDLPKPPDTPSSSRELAGPLDSRFAQPGTFKWGRRTYSERPYAGEQHWYPAGITKTFKGRFTGAKSSKYPKVKHFSSQKAGKPKRCPFIEDEAEEVCDIHDASDIERPDSKLPKKSEDSGGEEV